MSHAHHPVQWTAPSPTWPALTGTTDPAVRRGFHRPSILRFATDTFMDDFTATLTVDPKRLGEFIARPETWRGPIGSVATTVAAPRFARAMQKKRMTALRNAGAVATLAPAPLPKDPPVLKLYQPAHQRFYLVTASLVCQLPGLPDRAIDPAVEERATFLIRRLIPKPGVRVPTADGSTADEYAYVADLTGARWRMVSPPEAASIIPGEEQLPLFRTACQTEDGSNRKVVAGLIPVARREAYIAASPRPADGSSAIVVTHDPRLTLLIKQVTEPWRRLNDRAAAVNAILKAATPKDGVPSSFDREKTRRETREQIQTVSWYLLLDFAKYLQDHLPNVWLGLTNQPVTLREPERALLAAIDATVFRRDNEARSLRTMLVTITQREAQLEAVKIPYSELGAAAAAWPGEHFSLAIVQSYEALNGFAGPSPVESLVTGLTPKVLDDLVRPALPEAATARMPEAPLITRPALAPGDPGWFIIRCVYERPQCGPIAPPLVSEPTEVFQLAGFFDPDAPARPIRIGLPIDVSPAGLRKFDKNTAFQMSDMLCGNFNRVKSLTLADLVLSVLPWPFHKDLPTPAEPGPCQTDDKSAAAGIVCSLSIPIITLCALMLLLIIVLLLDLIFKWVPWFMVCFKVPGFGAKENA